MTDLERAREGCPECSGTSLCHKARRVYLNGPCAKRHEHAAKLLREERTRVLEEVKKGLVKLLRETESAYRQADLTGAGIGEFAAAGGRAFGLRDAIEALKASSGEEQS